MITVRFEHTIGEQVKIIAIGMLGRVDLLCLDAHGKQYRVVYWNEGLRYSTWLYDWELVKA